MLFQRLLMILLKANQSIKLKQKWHTMTDWSVIFWALHKGHSPRNGIWSDLIGLVVLYVCSSIWLNVEGYKTKNKVHINIKYICKWQQLDFNVILVPWPVED